MPMLAVARRNRSWVAALAGLLLAAAVVAADMDAVAQGARAAAAKAGIYGNDAVEARYPLAKNAADGSALDGSKHRYTLTFAKDRLPPVNAFWSVTMYEGKTQLLAVCSCRASAFLNVSVRG